MNKPDLKTTPLTALNQDLGAKLVPFAGYTMPVSFPMGALKEHIHTRKAAGLFDVSHMGQAWIIGRNGEDPASALEALVPADLQSLIPGQQRYTQLLNTEGGILDDLMITRPVEELDGPYDEKRLYLVVNAACKEADFAHINTMLGGGVVIERLDDRALLALQGPLATNVIADLFGSDLLTQPFMTQSVISWHGEALWLSRSGYTGEDGFEISVPGSIAADLARILLAYEHVEPIGLGARDSLRLEAGLCLYGQDIDTTTTPVEAGLSWSIGKRRREAGGFPGADIILPQLSKANPVTRRRVGLLPSGNAPIRAGAAIAASPDTSPIGTVTSGGYGGTLEAPIAMGYVNTDHAAPGMTVYLERRGKWIATSVVALPFTPARFYRGSK